MAYNDHVVCLTSISRLAFASFYSTFNDIVSTWAEYNHHSKISGLNAMHQQSLTYEKHANILAFILTPPMLVYLCMDVVGI